MKIQGAIFDMDGTLVDSLSFWDCFWRDMGERYFGNPAFKMDAEHFEALKKAKSDNYELIYKNDKVKTVLNDTVRPMMHKMYKKLLLDLNNKKSDSPIFTHHIKYVNQAHYSRAIPYEQNKPNQIVVDYIASMTDDYFIDLHAHFFPDSKLRVEYKGYFD